MEDSKPFIILMTKYYTNTGIVEKLKATHWSYNNTEKEKSRKTVKTEDGRLFFKNDYILESDDLEEHLKLKREKKLKSLRLQIKKVGDLKTTIKEK